MATWQNLGNVPQAVTPNDKFTPVMHFYRQDNIGNNPEGLLLYDIGSDGQLYWTKPGLSRPGWHKIDLAPNITLTGRPFLSPDGIRIYARGTLAASGIKTPVLCKLIHHPRPEAASDWMFSSTLVPANSDLAVSFDHNVNGIMKDYLVLLSGDRILTRTVPTTAPLTTISWTTVTIRSIYPPMSYKLMNVQAIKHTAQPQTPSTAPRIYCLIENQGTPPSFLTFNSNNLDDLTMGLSDVQLQLSDNEAARYSHMQTTAISKFVAASANQHFHNTLYAVENNILYWNQPYSFDRFTKLCPGNTEHRTLAGMPAVIQYNANALGLTNIPINQIFYTGTDNRLMHVAHTAEHSPWLSRLNAISPDELKGPKFVTQPNATVGQNGEVYVAAQTGDGHVHVATLTAKEMLLMNKNQ